jgi:hypothetical protein
MDELKLSWDKKVTMREIAQFYEDKLRELQSKNDVLNLSIIAQQEKIKKFEEKMREVSNDLKKAESGLYMEASAMKNTMEAKMDQFILEQKQANLSYEASKMAMWHVSLELFMHLFEEDDELRKRAIAWLHLLRDKIHVASQVEVSKEIKGTYYNIAFNGAVEMALSYLTAQDRTVSRITKMVEGELREIGVNDFFKTGGTKEED